MYYFSSLEDFISSLFADKNKVKKNKNRLRQWVFESVERGVD